MLSPEPTTIFPLTCNGASGLVVPIPTLPPSPLIVIVVIVDPPSLALKTISPFDTCDLIIKLGVSCDSTPNSTPLSLSLICAPSASRIRSPPASSVKSPALAILPVIVPPARGRYAATAVLI